MSSVGLLFEATPQKGTDIPLFFETSLLCNIRDNLQIFSLVKTLLQKTQQNLKAG